MKKIIRLTERDLTRIVKRVIKENEAPERYVIDVETGNMVGTHKYGVGFVVNKIGERMGYESHPTSIPDGTKMEKSDYDLGMDMGDFSSLRIREENEESLEREARIILNRLGHGMTGLKEYTRKELAKLLRKENKERSNVHDKWEELAKKLNN